MCAGRVIAGSAPAPPPAPASVPVPYHKLFCLLSTDHFPLPFTLLLHRSSAAEQAPLPSRPRNGMRPMRFCRGPLRVSISQALLR